MQWRPVAYVALRDTDLRRQLSDALSGEGWMVIAVPTGYHLVESMADLLLGMHTWIKPGLVVTEAVSPGCSGVTIARGLRDLGWSIPIALVLHSRDERKLLHGIDELRVDVVGAESVVPGVVEVARAHRPDRPDGWRAGASFRPATPASSSDRPLSN